MKILVTGGAGFVGYCFLKSIINNSEFIRVCDIEFNDNLYSINGLQLMKGNLCDYNFCEKVIDGIDIIYHFAGSGHGQLLSKNKKENLNLDSFNNNIISTVNLFNACIHSKSIKKIVQLSSAAVYGSSSTAVSENAKPLPYSSYAISKLCQEYYADIYYKLYNLNIVTLRCFNIYGYNENINPLHSNIVHKFIYLIKNSKSPLILGDPRFTRDYVYIDDVINSILNVSDNESSNGQIINIGTGVSTSLIQLVELINTHFGKEIKTTCIERNYNNISYSMADVKKSNEILKYKCNINLSEGIRLISEMI